MRDLFTTFALQQLYESWAAELEREQGWKRRGHGGGDEAGHAGRPANQRGDRARTGARARTPAAAEAIDRRPFRTWLGVCLR